MNKSGALHTQTWNIKPFTKYITSMDTKIHMLLVQTYQPRQAAPKPFVAAMFNILALSYIYRCCHVIAASFSQTFSRILPFQNVYTFNAANFILPKPKPRMQPFHLQTFVLQRRRQSVASKFPGRHFTQLCTFSSHRMSWDIMILSADCHCSWSLWSQEQVCIRLCTIG